jgi:AcrR family transcriptional regulator
MMLKPAKIRPPEDSRERLRQAAIAVFAESGYEAASIRAICQRAGLNVAMVRYHFGDKRGLYDEVIRYVADADARARILTQVSQNAVNPEDALRRSIHAVFTRLIQQNAESNLHLRLMLHELVKPSAILTDEVQALIRPLYDHFRLLVSSLLTLPIDHTKTRLFTHSILGQMVHYVQGRSVVACLWPDMTLSPSQIQMIADHIADFSLNSITSLKTQAYKRSVKK